MNEQRSCFSLVALLPAADRDVEHSLGDVGWRCGSRDIASSRSGRLHGDRKRRRSNARSAVDPSEWRAKKCRNRELTNGTNAVLLTGSATVGFEATARQGMRVTALTGKKLGHCVSL